jgi:hypothetical protein
MSTLTMTVMATPNVIAPVGDYRSCGQTAR